MGPTLMCFDPSMETSYLWVFKVQIQVGVDLKFQERSAHISNNVSLCPSARPKREFPNVVVTRGELGKEKYQRNAFSIRSGIGTDS